MEICGEQSRGQSQCLFHGLSGRKKIPSAHPGIRRRDCVVLHAGLRARTHARLCLAVCLCRSSAHCPAGVFVCRSTAGLLTCPRSSRLLGTLCPNGYAKSLMLDLQQRVLFRILTGFPFDPHSLSWAGYRFPAANLNKYSRSSKKMRLSAFLNCRDSCDRPCFVAIPGAGIYPNTSASTAGDLRADRPGKWSE